MIIFEKEFYINSLLIDKLDNQLKTNPDNNKLKFKLAGAIRKFQL